MYLTLPIENGNLVSVYERVEPTWARPLNWPKHGRRAHDNATADTFRIQGEIKDTSSRPTKVLPANALELQQRLRLRMSAAVIIAEQLEHEYPDPVQSLIDLFAAMPPDHGQWQDIIDEPYG